MTALTVGVTTAKNSACKRGVATNIAASLARHSAASARVCVVDADPLVLDEQALVVHVRGRGLVVITSCGHCGVINTLGRFQVEVSTFPG